jgi:purine-nucleoside phosphorylase
MNELRQMIDQAVAAIRQHTMTQPRIGIILGTGLGGLVDELDIETAIDYGGIPHFPLSTAESHKGRLIFGRLANAQVVVMQGRCHYYEGYTLQQVTFPVRVMKQLGVETLIISNASGGLNPHFRRGDIMIIADQINFLGDNPLIGPNDLDMGPRFPDMSEPYSEALIDLAESIAIAQKQKLQKGVFVAMTGPALETKAEYRFLRLIGADAVGMSTVPETIVAVHSGIKVLGFSIITDECFPDSLRPVTIEEMVQAANEAEVRLRRVIRGVVETIDKE